MVAPFPSVINPEYRPKCQAGGALVPIFTETVEGPFYYNGCLLPSDNAMIKKLRELRGPGKLSLVQAAYRGRGGSMLQARSRHARILIRVLLVQYRCVESLHVEDALEEGSGLGEFRECVVSTFRENTSLRTLILGSLFSEYRSIREELFGAIASMTNLCELAVLGSAAGPSVVLEAVCKLLVDTTCLVTLTIPRLVFDDGSGTRLTAALRRNKTVQNLSLHVSVMHSYMQSGIPRFSHFLANSKQLTSLSVEGVDTDPVSTFEDIKCIVRRTAFAATCRSSD
ncbi:uncharacterized protein LOC119399084 [Rhipicephalus sanguineus]|uniref:uncharacterized protein LOC119399084 n=1 Tax=Rhipicephalus sanguineus TaxID=34632 RepID=UPI0020C47346|nr:uncharacterized protein LOC119399084 [Rhipicephalus sanguineus]